MGKPLNKKSPVERRKKSRGDSSRTRTPSKSKAPAKSARSTTHLRSDADGCHHCGKGLEDTERALLVEEEVGRVFCTEECIAAFFSPEIERLEKEYFRRVSTQDLSGEEREKFAHLRWITLEEPDEVWREKTLAGDYRYTLISEFKPGTKPVWCVCLCLFLRGEPSFLYIAFPTRNLEMVNQYRRGERMQWTRKRGSAQDDADQQVGGGNPQPVAQARDGRDGKEGGESAGPVIDGLADAWTPEETMRAQISQSRSHHDIPATEFDKYQSCMDITLERPDEVWSHLSGSEGELGENLSEQASDARDAADATEELRIYHFIRHFPRDQGARAKDSQDGDEQGGIWYIIVARETDDEEQIEILDAFPTRDGTLVERFRQGEQEVGAVEGTVSSSRLVH